MTPVTYSRLYHDALHWALFCSYYSTKVGA